MTKNEYFMKRVNSVVARHRKLFGGSEKIRVFNAPGRINIIGEHTDYNGGYVFPAAIDITIIAAAAVRDDRQMRLKSMNFPGVVSINLDGLAFNEKQGWANFPLSAVWALEKHGIRLKGADIIFQGDIPLGSGLSSSAAIEVLTMKTMLSLCGYAIDDTLIPVYCREGENDFIGVKSGIMDQFVITLGKKDHALFLNCSGLDYRLIPLCKANKITIIAGNTKIKRELAKSVYNKRVEECMKGVEILKSLTNRNDIDTLGDITREEFDRFKDRLPDPIERRCEHVIYENSRVLEAVTALEQGDFERLGKLLFSSHKSLKELYEVSSRELDCMVDAFMRSEGVYGARMTGAGFGGSAIALADAEKADEIIQTASQKYEAATSIKGEFYKCSIADGAGEVNATV